MDANLLRGLHPEMQAAIRNSRSNTRCSTVLVSMLSSSTLLMARYVYEDTLIKSSCQQNFFIFNLGVRTFFWTFNLRNLALTVFLRALSS